MRPPLLISTILLAALGSGVAGGLVSQGFNDAASGDRVAAMIDERIGLSSAALQQDWRDSLGASIESYLLEDPTILERVSLALNQRRQAEQSAATREVIEANREVIFGGKETISIGNPDGDVTLVEMYDYNCEYCRRAFPDIVALIEQDPNLRIILRQFPILTQGSIDAAKIGILIENEGGDYWSYHQAMFTARGQVDLDLALQEAEGLGLDAGRLRAGLEEPTVLAALEESYDLARQLGISGTPTFILADEVIPGAVGADVLREKIANVRACGSTSCASSTGASEPALPQ